MHAREFDSLLSEEDSLDNSTTTGRVYPQSSPQSSTAALLDRFVASPIEAAPRLNILEFVPHDLQVKILRFLKPEEVVVSSRVNTTYYELSDDPQVWASFLIPGQHSRPGSPAYEHSRATFFTHVHLRQRSHSFTALGDFTRDQLHELLHNKELRSALITTKYNGNKMQAMINLSSLAIKDLIIKRQLSVDRAVALSSDAVTILGYTWIKAFCAQSEDHTRIALLLAQYPTGLVYSSTTRANFNTVQVVELIKSNHLTISQAMELAPQGRFNLQDEEIYAAFTKALISYADLNDYTSQQVKNYLQGIQLEVEVHPVPVRAAEGEVPAVKSCCRIS